MYVILVGVACGSNIPTYVHTRRLRGAVAERCQGWQSGSNIRDTSRLPRVDLFASFLHILHKHHTLLTFCEFRQAHAFYTSPYVQMTHVLTASRRLSAHACTAHEASMHMPHVTSNFMIHPRHPLAGRSGRPTQFLHMIPAFTSSNTLDWTNGALAYISDACAFL